MDFEMHAGHINGEGVKRIISPGQIVSRTKHFGS